MKNSDSSSSNANLPVVAADKAAITPAVGDPVIDVNLDQFSKTAVKNVNKMAKRTYVAESPIHGKGLFAAKDIKADVVLGRLHGMLTDKDGTYILWLNKRTGFEITNEFRFINHDSNPNCALSDTDVVTLRAIGKDEELTHDYGW